MAAFNLVNIALPELNAMLHLELNRNKYYHINIFLESLTGLLLIKAVILLAAKGILNLP